MFARIRRVAMAATVAGIGLVTALSLPAAAQQIDTLNPSIAEPGETVTIEGQGFLPGGGPNTNSVVVWDQTVTFGGSQVVSQTEITFQVPNGADCGPHDVQVENFNPSGTSSAVTLDVFCLDAVTPSQGSAGLPPISSPTTVTVKGGGFTDDRQVTLGGSTLFNPGSEVQINGQSANTTYVDSQTLEFDVPAGLACGSAQVQVVDPPLQDPTAPIIGGPSPLRSNTLSFTVNQPCGSGGGGGGNQAPNISSLSANPSNPSVGQSVSFLVGVSDPEGDPLSYDWDFGDGTTDTGLPISHTYSSAGSYTVTVTVSDNQGNSSSTTTTVQVGSSGGGGGGNQPPNASFSVGTSNPTVGQSVSFSNNSSDPEGDPLSFQWDFGDGNSSSNTSPTHTYNSSGSFTVQLTVSDNNGNSDTASQTITVQSSSGGGSGSGGGGQQQGLAQFDANNNCNIDDSEFFTIIDEWVQDNVSNSLFFDAIDAWVNQTDICAGSSSVAREPLAGVQLQTQPTASGVQFAALGPDVRSIGVRVFGLNGQLVADRQADRATLAWNLTTDQGERVANGVYLYRVTVRGPDGDVERTDVRKLIVRR